MTESIITSMTGILLIFSGFLSKNTRFKKIEKSKTPKVNYLYIFAGTVLVVIGMIQQF